MQRLFRERGNQDGSIPCSKTSTFYFSIKETVTVVQVIHTIALIHPHTLISDGFVSLFKSDSDLIGALHTSDILSLIIVNNCCLTTLYYII